MAGLAGAAVLVARRFAPDRPAAPIVVPAVAVAPLFLPYAVALLFGNLDALFPFAYGLVLVAAVAPAAAAGRQERIAGGVSLALATATKVAPGLLGAWFVGRVGRERRSEAGRAALMVLGVTVAVGLAVLGLSLLLGGVDLWRDYLPVATAASQAQLLDPRNVGPAAQIALAVGGDEQLVRTLQVPIAIGAVVASLAGGALVRDRLLGMSIAAVASLVILPITWYHYPVALIPFGIAAIARASGTPAAARTGALVAAAVAIASLSIAWVPGVWVAVAVFVAGVARARGNREAPGAPLYPLAFPIAYLLNFWSASAVYFTAIGRPILVAVGVSLVICVIAGALAGRTVGGLAASGLIVGLLAPADSPAATALFAIGLLALVVGAVQRARHTDLRYGPLIDRVMWTLASVVVLAVGIRLVAGGSLANAVADVQQVGAPRGATAPPVNPATGHRHGPARWLPRRRGGEARGRRRQSVRSRRLPRCPGSARVPRPAQLALELSADVDDPRIDVRDAPPDRHPGSRLGPWRGRPGAYLPAGPQRLGRS